MLHKLKETLWEGIFDFGKTEEVQVCQPRAIFPVIVLGTIFFIHNNHMIKIIFWLTKQIAVSVKTVQVDDQDTCVFSSLYWFVSNAFSTIVWVVPPALFLMPGSLFMDEPWKLFSCSMLNDNSQPNFGNSDHQIQIHWASNTWSILKLTAASKHCLCHGWSSLNSLCIISWK